MFRQFVEEFEDFLDDWIDRELDETPLSESLIIDYCLDQLAATLKLIKMIYRETK